MSDDGQPTPGALARGLLPGAFRALTVLLAAGALALGVGMVAFAAAVLGGTERVAMAAGGLIVWGHGAAWLTTGEVQRLDSALADLAGAQWVVFLAAWWAPVTVGWWAAGALAS